ncbi:MAG: glycosyltransferase [Nitrospirae bacterium]|nr:glycosyltransferase [Nitrospirota bacterium]
MVKRVCYFGTYDKNRPRNRIMIEGLKKAGVEVLECHEPVWNDLEDKSRVPVGRRWIFPFRFLRAYVCLIFRYLTLGRHDAVMVGYLGHFDMLLARPLARMRRKPVVFDAFLSLYDTVVEDRKLFRTGSLPARFLFWIDRTACRISDRVLLDTQAHIDYFVETFRLSPKKFRRVFVGADERLFYPCEEEGERTSPLKVLFYGQFIPLQGVEILVRSAKLLEDEEVAFTLIGKGQVSAEIHRLAVELGISNIHWIEWVSYERLQEAICRSDVGLGIFGDSMKARRVIPNKAFQILACRRPLITGDSPAARELLSHGESALLCRMADPHALAEAIRDLLRDPLLRRRIAEGGYRVFREHCRIRPEQILDGLMEKR